MTCPRTEDDAAFVLGALDPPAMRSFEAHLPGCPTCRAAVEELRVLPGLLARLLPGAAADAVTSAEELDPPDLLPGLTHRIRRERRRTRLRALSASAAAAVLAAAAGAAIAFGAAGTGADTALPIAQPATELTLTSSPDAPVEITVFLTGRGWGTSIDTRCRHQGTFADPGSPTVDVTYALYAVGRDGADVLVSSWKQIPVDEYTVPGSIGLPLADIERLELRNGDGQVLLTAAL